MHRNAPPGVSADHCMVENSHVVSEGRSAVAYARGQEPARRQRFVQLQYTEQVCIAEPRSSGKSKPISDEAQRGANPTENIESGSNSGLGDVGKSVEKMTEAYNDRTSHKSEADRT